MLKKLAKGLSQEEQTILSNIQALTQELMGAGSQGGMAKDESSAPVTTEKPSDMSAPSMTEEDKEKEACLLKKAEEEEGKKKEEEVAKEITATPSDGATANDEPAKRIEDVLTEVDVENIDEVKKAIALLKILKAQKAQKSQSAITDALVELTKVVKSVINKQNETELAIGNILEATGVTKQMEIAISQEKVQKDARQPIFHDNEKLAKSMADLLAMVKGEKATKSEDTPAQSGVFHNSGKVRKNLETAVQSLIRNP